jgi:hypothetical protein
MKFLRNIATKTQSHQGMVSWCPGGKIQGDNHETL